MSFIQALTEFFQSIFMSSHPEVKKRQMIRKLENELKSLAPNIYKNGLVEPNFAEAIRILFVNTKEIENILSETICSEDITRNRHFEEQLLLTGFSSEQQEILESLAYEKRKIGAKNASSLNRYFENEHKKLENVVKEMNSTEFIKIDYVLDRIKQLNDICKFGFVSALRLFDSSYSTSPNYVPNFASVPADLLETSLLDLYYVIADMDISTSLYKALLALAELKNGKTLSERQTQSLKENLKKIQGLIKHIFTNEILVLLIRIAKQDVEFVPNHASYKGSYRKKYANLLETRFRVDEERLKGELQDETISEEVNEIFGNTQLLSLRGYNTELNNQLKHSTPCSFMWVLPMQILKTFVKNFYEGHVKPLLNDIVIEGMFNNPTYKSDFSSTVFACNEILERIEGFEQMFNRGSEFDEANIVGLIHDSHKDQSFENSLKNLCEQINHEAKNLLQAEVNNINSLNKKISDIISESKKPSSDSIQNLKVLMISSRNRDNSNILESQHEQWNVFLEIMKNYVIIGGKEKKQ